MCFDILWWYILYFTKMQNLWSRSHWSKTSRKSLKAGRRTATKNTKKHNWTEVWRHSAGSKNGFCSPGRRCRRHHPRWRRSDLHKVKRWIGPNLTSCPCICLLFKNVSWCRLNFLKVRVMLDGSQLLLKGKHFPEFNGLYVPSNSDLIDQDERWENKRNHHIWK